MFRAIRSGGTADFRMRPPAACVCESNYASLRWMARPVLTREEAASHSIGLDPRSVAAPAEAVLRRARYNKQAIL